MSGVTTDDKPLKESQLVESRVFFAFDNSNAKYHGIKRMKIKIYRGTREIGGNCIEIESRGTRLILDVGMPLFGPNREVRDTSSLRRQSTAELAASGILPTAPGLFDGQPHPRAILLSHAHEDHTGLLQHSHPEIPVYASVGTSKMMSAGSRFAGQPHLPAARFRELLPGQATKIYPFQITPFSVDHSIFGAMAFLIESDNKSVLYSGDLRMHGRKPGMLRTLLNAISDKTIDVLVMEGTHIDKPEYRGPNEYELENEIFKTVNDALGLVLVSFSPQHVDRFVAFLKTAKRTGRIFVADPYAAFILHLLRTEGSFPVPETSDFIRVFVPENFKGNFGGLEKVYFLWSKIMVRMEEIRNEPSRYLMIFRPSMVSRDFGNSFPSKSCCIFSRWSGYLDRPEWQAVNNLLQQGEGKLIELHTSGHIFGQDSLELVNRINPKLVIPIHTFEPQRFAAANSPVKILTDGEPFEV